MLDDMTADIMTNKKFQARIKQILIRYRNVNISSVFITQSSYSVPKEVRLNSTHYLIVEINNKRELQNIATNHSAEFSLSSKELHKYEYFTGEDLGYK